MNGIEPHDGCRICLMYGATCAPCLEEKIEAKNKELSRLREEHLDAVGMTKSMGGMIAELKKENERLRAEQGQLIDLACWASDRMNEGVMSEDGMDGSIADEMNKRMKEIYRDSGAISYQAKRDAGIRAEAKAEGMLEGRGFALVAMRKGRLLSDLEDELEDENEKAEASRISSNEASE